VLFRSVIDKKFFSSAIAPGDKVVLPSVTDLSWRCVATASAHSFFGKDLINDTIIDVFLSFHVSVFKVINAQPIIPSVFIPYIANSVRHDTDVMKAFIIPEVEKRRQEGNAEKDTVGNYYFANILQCMIESKNPQTGELLTSEEIAQRCMTLILASMVTTAGVLVHVLTDLAGRGALPLLMQDTINWKASPEVEEYAKSVPSHITVREALELEMRDALTSSEGAINDVSMNNMPVLTSFISESMRLGALPIQQSRYASKDGEIGDYFVEKDCYVYMSGVLSGRDPELFPDPDTFVPLRFFHVQGSDPVNSAASGLFPFGTGRRVCVGRHFAMYEVKLVIILLMQRFHFQAVSGEVAGYKYTPSDCLRAEEEVMFVRK